MVSIKDRFTVSIRYSECGVAIVKIRSRVMCRVIVRISVSYVVRVRCTW